MKRIQPEYELEVTEVHDGVKFEVAAHNRGQIVEIADGYTGREVAGDGAMYQRHHDRSDGTTKYYKRTKRGGWL